MNTSTLSRVLVTIVACVAFAGLHAQGLDPERQAKVDQRLTAIKGWAADPVIVGAVRAQNAQLPAAHAAMTQEKWKSLTLLDPFVRSFTRNEAGVALKNHREEWVAEAFLNDAAGLKVAFLGKTSGWSHASSPKHAKPIAGENWQGPVELDDSTGLQQIQVAVPVVDEGKPIGSLVVGIALSKLE